MSCGDIAFSRADVAVAYSRWFASRIASRAATSPADVPIPVNSRIDADSCLLGAAWQAQSAIARTTTDIAIAARLQDDRDRAATELPRPRRLTPRHPDHDLARQGGAHARSRRQRDRQPPARVLPAQRQAHPVALTIAERLPVVFEQLERAVRARVDRDRQRTVHRLSGVLLHRAHRDDGPGTHVERHHAQVDGAIDLAAALDAALVP